LCGILGEWLKGILENQILPVLYARNLSIVGLVIKKEAIGITTALQIVLVFLAEKRNLV